MGPAYKPRSAIIAEKLGKVFEENPQYKVRGFSDHGNAIVVEFETGPQTFSAEAFFPAKKKAQK